MGDDRGAGHDEYNGVLEALQTVSSGFSFQFHFAESGVDAIAKLSATNFDFVILDAVLEKNWLEGVGHRDLLDHIANSAPFALVTSRFDDSSRELTSSVMKNGRCQCFISWGEFAAFSRYPAPLFSLIAASSNSLSALDTTLRLGPDENITILHISDIQSGGYPNKDDQVEIQIIANAVLDACKGSAPTFLVISGDLAEKGLPSEFSGAIGWIRELCKSMGFPNIPSSRCFSVPGNHDFCLPLAAAANCSFKAARNGSPKKPKLEAEVLNAELIEFAFAPYCDAQSKISIERRYIAHAGHARNELNWVDASFSHLGVVFYGINTVWPVASDTLPERSVDPVVAGAIGNELEKLKRSIIDRQGMEPYIVGVMHHSPFGDVSDRSVTNSAFFSKFLMGAGASNLVLFGHVHKSAVRVVEMDDRTKIVSSRASTVTKRGSARPEDSNRGLNLVDLSRSGGAIVNCAITTFEWRGEQLVANKLAEYPRI